MTLKLHCGFLTGMLTDMSIVGFRYHSLAFPPNISDVSLIVTKDSVDRLFVKVYLHFQSCRYFENESDLSLNYLFISRCITRRSAKANMELSMPVTKFKTDCQVCGLIKCSITALVPALMQSIYKCWHSAIGFICIFSNFSIFNGSIVFLTLL